jgi:excisionase family DNA binding protein
VQNPGRHGRLANPIKAATTTMRPEELGDMLGVSRASIYAGLRSGVIPSIRIGKRYIIARSAIDEWLRTAGQRN